MKPIVIALILCVRFCSVEAQKFALIDETLTKPVHYTDHVLQRDISDRWFPVEKQKLHEFRVALSKIYKQLKKEPDPAEGLSFDLGCLTIKGTPVMVLNERRYSYILSFQCDQINATYLLCDPRLKNSINAFIVKTWIKYLGAKENH